MASWLPVDVPRRYYVMIGDCSGTYIIKTDNHLLAVKAADKIRGPACVKDTWKGILVYLNGPAKLQRKRRGLDDG